MDKGELLRLLGEMVLIPSAFLDCAPAVHSLALQGTNSSITPR